jgi:two-component system chemotaxis response regulator CheY
MAKTVLVIDDAASIRQVVKLVLGEEGYVIVEAEDGLDAVSKLDGKDIDCIVCDVNMPNMNGIEFLEKVKTDDALSAYKFIPFIMLTTESSESMKAKGKELGAKAWLVKPFQPEQLLESIKKLIG